MANVRLHATTGQRPIDRFRPEALRPLPELLPECRETKYLKVHTDFSICFDANRYTVPPCFVGKQVIAKADADLLVCDEPGYLSLGEQGSHLFFQVISQRHRQKSSILTTNKLCGAPHNLFVVRDVRTIMELWDRGIFCPV